MWDKPRGNSRVSGDAGALTVFEMGTPITLLSRGQHWVGSSRNWSIF